MSKVQNIERTRGDTYAEIFQIDKDGVVENIAGRVYRLTVSPNVRTDLVICVRNGEVSPHGVNSCESSSKPYTRPSSEMAPYRATTTGS